MSTEFTCDSCKVKAPKPALAALPENWMQITINGYVPRVIRKYGGAVSTKKDICLECAKKLFPDAKDVDKTSLSAQFEEVATDLIHDIVADIIESNYDGGL